MAIPLLVVLAEGRLVQLAKWSSLVLAVHAALTAAAAALQLGLFGIAAVATFLRRAELHDCRSRRGPQSLGVFSQAARAVGAVVVPALVAFLVPSLMLGGGDSLAKGAAAGAWGCCSFWLGF